MSAETEIDFEAEKQRLGVRLLVFGGISAVTWLAAIALVVVGLVLWQAMPVALGAVCGVVGVHYGRRAGAQVAEARALERLRRLRTWRKESGF